MAERDEAAAPEHAAPGVSRSTGAAVGLPQAAVLRLLVGAPAGIRRASAVGAQELLRLQRTVGNRAAQRVRAREFAIAPTVANPAAVTLTPAQLRAATLMNEVLFTDAGEIAVLRDVLGISREPSVVDDDLAMAIAQYQASYGLTVDGKLGAHTSDRLAGELTAEADFLGQPATGTALRRAARRLHLRSMTSRTHGTYGSQGFVGSDDNPSGAVTVRFHDTDPAATDSISLEYTGEDASSVHWLQFDATQMVATPPGGGGPVFATGTQAWTNGPMPWSNVTTRNWVVDSVAGSPAAAPSPFYDVSGFLSTNAPNRRIAMIDEPNGVSALGVAQAFAAAGPAAGATSVTISDTFSSYVVKGNKARYRVDWVTSTTYDITAGTALPIAYGQRFAGRVGGLRPEHRTALLAKYAGSPIV
jgi:hypothetical protein